MIAIRDAPPQETTALGQIIGLDDPRATESDLVGQKAATLARLRAAGHSVPDGFVVTTSACSRLGGAGDVLEDQLATVFAELDGGPLAVRSSGVAEDLAGASFAGQFETVLGVETVDDLCRAVDTCVASARSDRAMAYAGSQAAPMAVLVQRQIPAAAAGASFSADPVTGDRDVTLVSAIRGLGDRLMSGEATPDEWRVRDGEARKVTASEGAISEDQARRIAELTERLEAELGTPQDVEWAIADGELAVLQARPITALPVEPSLEVLTEGTWIKDQTHYAELLTPLGASVYLPALDAGLNQMFETWGLIIERIENRSLGGEVYGHVVPVGGKEGPPPPWWLMAVLARVVPPMRARMKTAARIVDEGRLDKAPRRWHEEWRPEFRRRARALREVELAGLGDIELIVHLDQTIELLGDGQLVHFELFPPHVVGVHEFTVACEELLGWSAVDAMDLLAGLSEASSEPAQALADLAERIVSRPELADLAHESSTELVAALEQRAPDLSAEFADHVDRYAHRSVNYDAGAPTLAERPHLLASLLRDALGARERDLAGELKRRREEAEARAERALAKRSEPDRARFLAALEAARRVYPLREDNIFWTDNVPCGLIRRAAIEIGRRLTDRRQLGRADLAVFLEAGELREALRDPKVEIDDLVRRRWAERAWVAAHPGPPFHGDAPSAFPDVRGLPDAARRINGAFLWFMKHEYQPAPVDGGDGIGGVPGSPGRYTGPVRVVTGEASFDRLRPGDVLVAPITTPAWSVLFRHAGAVVTDGGGTLAHAAIVAREHGIPAVLSTGDATTRLTDGQIVTVDGAAGIVTLAEQS